MNQQSKIGFGSNISRLAGYAQHANAQLGNIDLVIENCGANTLTFAVKEYVGTTAAPTTSGYQQVGGFVSVVAGGVKTVSYNLLSKRVGFFGSGNTTASISTSYRNKGDLRGAQIDIVTTGRRGYTIDDGFNYPDLGAKWGGPPDSTSDTSPGFPDE